MPGMAHFEKKVFYRLVPNFRRHKKIFFNLKIEKVLFFSVNIFENGKLP